MVAEIATVELEGSPHPIETKRASGRKCRFYNCTRIHKTLKVTPANGGRDHGSLVVDGRYRKPD